MNEPSRPPFSPRVVVGFVLIALGILFTLDTFDIIDAGSIIDYWPLVLIIPGVSSLVWPRKHADRFWGAVLVAVGTLLLLRNLGFFWFRFRHLWPVDPRRPRRLPDLAGPRGPEEPGWRSEPGSGSVRRPAHPRRRDRGPAADERVARAGAGGVGERLDEFAMFGGGDRMLRSRSFRGGNVTAIMGGFDIDLRDADIAGDAARIEVFVIMGGIDLKVPENWTVVMDVTPFMGGADYNSRNRRAPAEGPQKVLTVSGFVFMGGVEVKH